MFIALRRRKWSSPLGGASLWLGAMALILIGISLASAQEGSAANQVTDIRASGGPDDLSVVISTTRRPDSSVFTMSAPSRIVVDIEDALPGSFTAPIAVNKGPVKDITAKAFQDAEGTVTRITIRLDSVVDYTSSIGDHSLSLRITPRARGGRDGYVEEGDLIGAQLAQMGDGGEVVEEMAVSGGSTSTMGAMSSADAVGAPAEIIGLDFLPYQNRSRVRIKGTSRFRYRASPVSQDGEVVIDIPGATIAKALQRPLDTSEFPSAVKLVAAYPVRGSQSGVRVVIKLRASVDYQVDEQGNILYLDFPVPASIAAKLAQQPVDAAPVAPTASAAPEDSNQPITTLISSTGKVSKGGAGMGGAGAQGGSIVGALGGADGGQYTGRRISIDVREADLHNIFRMISNVSKLNVVAGDNVKGRVTIRLQDIPWDQALAVILQSKGLGAVRFGNIIRIAPMSMIEEERRQRLNAQKAERELESLQTLIIPLNYAIASDVRKQVEGALTERGKLTLDSRTNSLIIEDTASGLAKTRQLALSLDTPTPQVLIEARIVEVGSTSVKAFGIQWGGDVEASAATGVGTGLYFPSSIVASGGLSDAGQAQRAGSGLPNWVVDLPAASKGGALSLSLGSLSGIVNVDARLSAIENLGKGRVISAPKVITVDNKEAIIKQGTRIPYESVSAAGTTVQFIEATLTLEVTPHITRDNRVFLKVKVTNNRPDFGQAVNGRPAIEIKEASTEVMVKDGDTTVLGGVYTLVETTSVANIPLLGRIPFFGWLFKNTAERSERKELLVFITPHVIKREPARG